MAFKSFAANDLGNRLLMHVHKTIYLMLTTINSSLYLKTLPKK